MQRLPSPPHPANDVETAGGSPVTRAVAILERDLARAWTVSTLARAAGASRATLARRFVAELGTSPMRYLARRRLEHAAELVASTPARLAEIARAVGYESEFALGRAFRRHHGISPGRYRARQASTPIRAAA